MATAPNIYWSIVDKVIENGEYAIMLPSEAEAKASRKRMYNFFSSLRTTGHERWPEVEGISIHMQGRKMVFKLAGKDTLARAMEEAIEVAVDTSIMDKAREAPPMSAKMEKSWQATQAKWKRDEERAKIIAVLDSKINPAFGGKPLPDAIPPMEVERLKKQARENEAAAYKMVQGDEEKK